MRRWESTRFYPASITKLMTALVAAEAVIDLSDQVEILREDTLTEGSSMYLKVGERVTVEALFYGLLLQSGNDAALALARYCAGDVETFVSWMNQKARDLGMMDSHFANPNGLDDDGHYSTAADMAILARAVLEREELRVIASTRSVSIAGRTLVNHNKLLWRYEGCTGLKTGYTDEAGRTLVSSTLRDGQELIAVTLNAPNDWADHTALFDYGFATYPRTLVKAAGAWVDIPVANSLCRFVRAGTAAEFYYPLAQGEEPEQTIQAPQQVTAPVLAGFPAGRVVITLNGDEIAQLPLLYETGAASNLAPKGWLARLFG